MQSKVFDLIRQEEERQKKTVNLIASENYCSENVKKALVSDFLHKYAEGQPGKRFYAGCQIVDGLETYAIDLAKKVFGCEHANLQPHSGSDANLAAYNAVLNPGDKVLAMSMSAGGHLTHGHKMSITSKLYNFSFYGVDLETGLIDYDQIKKIALEQKPKLIIAGGSAYSRIIDFKKFRKIADECGALLMVDMAHFAGLVAAGLYYSPVPYADIVTLTTHKTLRGPRGGMILCKKEFASKVDKSIMPGVQGGPHVNVVAAKAVALEEALTEQFKNYQKQVLANAKTFEVEFKKLGYKLVSGGTDTHLLLIDIYSTFDGKLTGAQAERILEKNGIITNRNLIPGDKLSPLVTSGLRTGTPAITSQGHGFIDVQKIVKRFHDLLST